MKHLITLVIAVLIGLVLNAQTDKELAGKWKLVSWTTTTGEQKDIQEFYKTDQVYQVFDENGKFRSLIGDKVHKGKWKLQNDNKILKLTVGLIVVNFDIISFDDKKRVISNEYGTFSYEKVAS